jgi:uncharacterized membrane protein YbhN (UPF0104 family)
MAAKKGKREQEGGGLLSGIPLGSALEVAEGVGAVLVKLAAQRYEVDKKVEKIRHDTEKRVEELRDEAVRTGYELKKALLRTVVEGIFLTTGLLALILGAILVVADTVPLKYVLLAYGLAITALIVFTLKTQSDELPRKTHK